MIPFNEKVVNRVNRVNRVNSIYLYLPGGGKCGEAYRYYISGGMNLIYRIYRKGPFSRAGGPAMTCRLGRVAGSVQWEGIKVEYVR